MKDIVLAALGNGSLRLDTTSLLAAMKQAMRTVVGSDDHDSICGWRNGDVAISYAARDPRTSDLAVAITDDGSFTCVDGLAAALEPARRPAALGERCAISAVQDAARAWHEGYAGFATLSGSFLGIHHDSQRRRTLVFTDRLGSRPIFCRAIEGVTYVASDIRPLLQLQGGACELDIEALVQFVRYQMILGARTLYKQITMLAPATVLEAAHREEELTRRSYWALSPLPFFTSMEEAVEATARALTAATERVTASSQRLAILLSGGFDSRMLMASLAEPERARAAAFTFGPGLTDEALVAHEVAAHCATPWNFVEEPLRAYWEYLADGLLTSNGLHSAAHLHFTYPVALIAGAGYDTVLNGWGFDLPFSGSYFPKETIGVLGRELYTNRLVRLATAQEATQHLHTALDVQAGCFANSLLGQKLRPHWEEGPSASLGQLVTAAASASADPYDWIDYTLFGFGVAKFRSYSLVMSTRAQLRERNPLFESDVLEVYQRLPAGWRFLGPIFRRGLRELSPALAMIPYSNIGTSGFAHPYLQAAAAQVRAAWRANLERARQLGQRVTRGQAPASARFKYGAYHHATSMVGHLRSETPTTRQVQRLLSNGPLVDAGILDPRRLPSALERCATGSSKSAYTLLCWIALAIWLDAYPAAMPLAAG